jgi:hypothetical protein
MIACVVRRAPPTPGDAGLADELIPGNASATAFNWSDQGNGSINGHLAPNDCVTDVLSPSR